MFHLKSQNRALSLEMLRYKRQLSEARKELDMIRGKSREMESLVSIIQRAWSQVLPKISQNVCIFLRVFLDIIRLQLLYPATIKNKDGNIPIFCDFDWFTM
jgi:hypothetical protein